MDKIFEGEDERAELASELEFATYGLAMLHSSYTNKREAVRRTPADKDGNRKTVTHVFSEEELEHRRQDTARASRFVRERLDHYGVCKSMLDTMSDKELYYYAMGISQC